MPGPTITHLERRKIEAGVLIPMVQAFQRAIGTDRANEIAREAILELARKDGERWAQQFGQDLPGMDRVFGVASGGGSLEIEQLEKSVGELHFNVTRCQYAEFFRELGLPELGYLFACNRDFAMVEGFSRGITLRRTQTIMEGADHCDFRFDGGRIRRGEQDGGQRPGGVTIESVYNPGSTSTVDAGMYHAMRDAMLKVLPTGAPGMTRDQMLDALVPHLPADLFPGGAKAGWWSRAVQLDLEAKGVIARESSEPLRWHRIPE
jgi:hypothetical protein